MNLLESVPATKRAAAKMRGIIDLPCSEYVRHEGFLCESIGPVAAHRLEFRSRPDSRLRAPNAAIAGMKSVMSVSID
jgi:hypothetical protein